MLKQNTSDRALSEALPYWELFSDPSPHLILADNSITAGLAVSLTDIECFDARDVNQFTEGLRNCLNSIPEEVNLQFYLRVGSDFEKMLSKHESAISENAHQLTRDLASERLSRLRREQSEQSLYKPELFLFLRVPCSETKKIGFLKKEEEFQQLAEATYEEARTRLFETLEQIEGGLSGLGVAAKRLSAEEITAMLYRFFNPKRKEDAPPPRIQLAKGVSLSGELLEEAPWLSESSFREQLVFGDLVLDLNEFTLDSTIHKIVSLKTLPETTFAGMMAEFLRMPFHYELMLDVVIPSQSDEMGKLNQKRRMAHSLAITQGNKASDLESESKLSSAEELIRELLNSGQRIYATEMKIILRSPASDAGRRDLNRKVREILSRFRALNGAEALEESVGAWKVLKGTLPLASTRLERARKMKTNNLADFLPLYGPRLGDEDPAVILKNRLGGLVSVDPFSPMLPNYNALVTGSSGAGKSFLNNCILLQEMARGLRVFIIDIGGSYRKLTDALGGQYLDISLSDAYRLNPFELPKGMTSPSDIKIKSLLAMCELMVREDDKEKLPKLDGVLLEKAIIEVYEETLPTGKMPKLSDLKDKLAKSPEPSLQVIAKLLYSWTGDRPYGKLLDGDGALRSDAAICTFDLKGLSSYPDLQGVMILILTDFILGQVEGDRTTRKRIILDEAWELLKSPASASFMEYCARTLRKTGSGITFITQGVEEIVASPIGPAILNNTAMKMVLLQRGDTEILRDALKLNDQEIGLIHSLHQKKGEFSEGFLIEGDERQVIRVSPTPLEYWLSTSDAQDNRELYRIKDEEKLSLIDAIKMAAIRFPQGMAIAIQNQNRSKAA